eukprot:1132603-Prymnesium_polylepis.1
MGRSSCVSSSMASRAARTASAEPETVTVPMPSVSLDSSITACVRSRNSLIVACRAVRPNATREHFRRPARTAQRGAWHALRVRGACCEGASSTGRGSHAALADHSPHEVARDRQLEQPAALLLHRLINLLAVVALARVRAQHVVHELARVQALRLLPHDDHLALRRRAVAIEL